jgi:hypothetical protein
MKKRTAKVWTLVFAAAVPGMCTFSCSTAVLQQFRDAAVQGAASVVQTTIADLLSSMIPELDEE